MKKVIHLIAIVLALNSHVFAQKNDFEKEIFNNLNKIRKDLKVREFHYDSSFNNYKASLSANYKFLNNKDSLRSILRKNGNFDYNVEAFQMEMKNTNELSQKNIKKKYPKLNDVLNDSLFNNVEHYIEKRGNKFVVLLVASQNFIEFDKEFILDIKEGIEGTSESIIIPGKSKINDIFYTVTNKENSQNISQSEKKRINLKEGNRFELQINLAGKKVSSYIEVSSSEGRILSFIPVKER